MEFQIFMNFIEGEIETKTDSRIKRHVANGLCFPVLAIAGFLGPAAHAQDEADTFAGSFAVPVFNSIDSNGVDLTTGTWRVKTPVVVEGAGDPRESPMVNGLEWTGEAWRHIGIPQLWRDDGKYIVIYKGQSHEFNGRKKGFSPRAPIDGSSLSCQFELPSDVLNFCTFINRDGDEVYFGGFESSQINYGPDFGFSAMRYGNVGMHYVFVSEAAFGSPPVPQTNSPNVDFAGNKKYGFQPYGLYLRADQGYDEAVYRLSVGRPRLTLETPNNNQNDEHYLRPKGTTQTLTDDYGKQWEYSINSDRELTRVQSPGGLSAVTASYDDRGRVKSITSEAGVTTYSYTRPGDYGTTTSTNPLGEETYVKYHREYGFVTEHRDPIGRLTTYQWNLDTKRLDRINYPDGNHTTFTYDSRSNVLFRRDYPKVGGTPLVSQAGGFPTCTASNRMNCNKPRWTIDPNGNRTDYQFTDGIHAPTKIISPAPEPGAPRPSVTNLYSDDGLLQSSTVCRTLEDCVGTSDSVVTNHIYQSFSSASVGTYDYMQAIWAAPIETTVSADGQTLRSCMRIDARGQMISSTPPNAGLQSCPAGVVDTVPVTSNPPENGIAKVAATFPDGAGGGGGNGTIDLCNDLPPGVSCE